ncbi:DUF1062 domain-containing protein [Fusibacter ferrireducens]|uniref:Recombinase zinc beta ribbon domain-containing protein n=1 Tax=Fusibacter ferrireducens TaxID=2785058 RepID=A0ABR9ZVB0_9FIRM|nr:hypothetical protein [Fusibacter ferrireducens]MBF4694113.1 hypothetical protein [Fusibacter ferrireducens]
MIKSKHINWVIQTSGVSEVERYCHNCGQKVIFKDSLVRRQNANGKNIHHFAIYKCDRGHTWNKKIEQFKVKGDLENKKDFLTSTETTSEHGEIIIDKLLSEGYEILEISVRSDMKIRVDKVLAQCISDRSRTQLNVFFERNDVTVNNKNVSGCFKVYQDAVIRIRL